MDQQLTTDRWQKNLFEDDVCSSSPRTPHRNPQSSWADFESAVDEVELVDGRLRRKAPARPPQPAGAAIATPNASPSKQIPRRLDTSSHHLIQARNLLNSSSSIVRDRSSPAQDTSSPAVPSLDAGGSSTADSVDYAGRQDQAGSTASVTTGSSAEIILDLSKGTHGQKTSRNRWPKPKREPPLNPEELAIREHGGSAFPSNETDYGAGVGLRREAAMEQTNEWDAPGEPFISTTFGDRPALSEGQIRDRVDEWLPSAETAADQCTILLRSIPSSTTEQAVEIAPRTWYPLDIDGEHTNDWWTEHLKNPLVDDEASPWWVRYPNPVANYLLTLPYPEVTIDPTDNEMDKVKGQTSQSTSQRFMKTNLESSKHKQFVKAPSKDDSKHQKQADVLNNIGYAPMYNEFSPRLNVFVRPAEEKDIPEIREIYNEYIKKSIACPEMEPLSSGGVRARMEDIEEAKLPFLVAVDRAGRPMQLSGGGRRRPPKKGTIVGFAFADDYNDMRGMYRYTVEVELFVDPAFTRYGVGRCLLDKTIHVLDSGYNAHGGYDFITDSMGFAAGGRRTIACIIVHVPYSRHTTEELVWKKRFLETFGFEQSGDLKGIGRKQSQAVSLATFSRPTMVTVEEYAV